MQAIEKTGAKFDLDTYFKARLVCQDVVQKIARQIKIGISEREGQQLIREEFLKAGVKKFWHPSKFRIGPETTKTFRALADPSIRLNEGDNFFLDVGPIIDDHEADYGETFVLSSKMKHSKPLNELAEASKKVWLETAHQWKKTGLSGKGLLRFAGDLTQSLGYELNPKMAGHRLGDFPHALFSKDHLFELDIVPSPNLWVLEIHITHADLERGAFFEDILLEDEGALSASLRH